MIEKIKKIIGEQYSPQQYPCLFEQYEEFHRERPLKGLKIVHSTPLFKNALPKILPLLVSGADVRFSSPSFLRGDEEVIRLLKQFGIYGDDIAEADIDIVMDCVGSCSHLKPRLGAIELTKSGESHYQNKNYPVICIDRSRVKLIEDMLGTADGFLRALKKLNKVPQKDSKILLFGFGKVGKGIVNILKSYEPEIVVVELPAAAKEIKDIQAIDFRDYSKIKALVGCSDYIITCTGVRNIIQDNYDIRNFVSSHAVCINMGAEDEYGDAFPEERVLNSKKPLNFILEEPTRLEFLDPVFALHNQCALFLKENSGKLAGNEITSPPKYLEEEVIARSLFKDKT